MSKQTKYLSAAFVAGWLALTAHGAAYTPPPGGWEYMYDGSTGTYGTRTPLTYNSLDGTWAQAQSSGTWDGNAPGAGGGRYPGGIGTFTESGTTFLRLQDAGDGRNNGFTALNGGDNRKLALAHVITTNSVQYDTCLDDGVTITFRARIPAPSKTTSPLDNLYFNNTPVGVYQPYPAAGDGEVAADNGKGNFVIAQNIGDHGRGFSFSLTVTNDGTATPGTNTAANSANFRGLTCTPWTGASPADNLNFTLNPSSCKVYAFDPTDWHEFWIVIKRDPSTLGTHVAYIFMDGGTTPVAIKSMTASWSAAEVAATSYIGMYSTSGTTQSGALDVDFYGYKGAEVYPAGAILPPQFSEVSPSLRKVGHDYTSNLTAKVTAMGTNTISTGNVSLVLNGANVTGSSTLTQLTPQGVKITYGLAGNTIYSGQLVAQQSDGLKATNVFYFDTFSTNSARFIESEDYNYSSGTYVAYPTYGLADYKFSSGTSDTDFSSTNSDPGLVNLYRFDTTVGISKAYSAGIPGDVLRPGFVAVDESDYRLNKLAGDSWYNYTQTNSAGTYYVYLRAASTNSGQKVNLSKVTSNPAVGSQTTAVMGGFLVPKTSTINSPEYAPLNDVNGSPLPIVLPAGANTLRVSVMGASTNYDLAMNYLVVVPGSGGTAPSVGCQPPAGAVDVPCSQILNISIIDGSNPVNTNTIALTVNGGSVTPASISKADGVTLVTYAPSPYYTAGAVQTIGLTFNDGTARSRTWTFTTSTTPVLGVQSVVGGINVLWESGVLLSSPTVNGTYTPVATNSSPLFIPTSSLSSQQFYKVQF